MADLLTLNVAGPTVHSGTVTVPEPTADGHAANRAWVLAAIAAAIDGEPTSENNDRYWGASSASSLANSAAVLALSGHDAVASKTKVLSITPDNEYVYFAYPERLGALESVLIDGLESFPDDFEEAETVSVTPVGGVAEDYLVYRTANLLDAAFTFSFDPA